MRKKDSCIAIFGGQRFRAKAGLFYGARLLALFGGVNCDLNDVTFAREATIRVFAIFGGVEIRVPADVRVEVRSVSLFGGVSDLRKTPCPEDAPSLYIRCLNLFGGTDIR